MQHRFASDAHSHTTFSPDGSNSPMEMLEKANEIGLYYYTITDHCECNNYTGSEVSGSEIEPSEVFASFDFKKNSKLCFEHMEEMQKRNIGKTKLLRGIELGQAMQNMEAAEEVVARDYDFVLASVHNVGGFNDFYWLDYDNVEDGYIDGLISKYFAEILEMIKWGKFNSLSHLTYPVRYIKTPDKKPYTLDAHMDEIKAVLQAVIDDGAKAIELNTSGIRFNGETQPNQEILNLYHDMGGKYITIGSDSHKAEHLGGGIDEGLEMIKAAGFSEFTVYVGGEPQLLPID